MTLTPSLHRARHSAPASVPILEIYEPILLHELCKGEFHLMCSWLRSGRSGDDGGRGGSRHECADVYSLVRLLIRATEEHEHD